MIAGLGRSATPCMRGREQAAGSACGGLVSSRPARKAKAKRMPPPGAPSMLGPHLLAPTPFPALPARPQIHNWAADLANGSIPSMEFVTVDQAYTVIDGQKQELDILGVGVCPMEGGGECVSSLGDTFPVAALSDVAQQRDSLLLHGQHAPKPRSTSASRLPHALHGTALTGA